MTIRLNPYLGFAGTAREALEFYRSVLGGELTVMTFGDLGGMGMPEEQHGLVMHAQLEVSEAVTLMGADMAEGDNGAISLSGGPEDEATLRSWFDGLSEGGTPGVPLDKAPWGDWFGQLTDRFGVRWLVNIAGEQQG